MTRISRDPRNALRLPEDDRRKNVVILLFLFFSVIPRLDRGIRKGDVRFKAEHDREKMPLGRGAFCLFFVVEVFAFGNVGFNCTTGLLGQGNTAGAGNAAAFAAHDFQHVVFAALGAIALEQFDVFLAQAVNALGFDFGFVADDGGNRAGNAAGKRKLASLSVGYGRELGRFAFVDVDAGGNQHGAKFFKGQNIVDVRIVFGFDAFGQAGANEDGNAVGMFFF